MHTGGNAVKSVHFIPNCQSAFKLWQKTPPSLLRNPPTPSEIGISWPQKPFSENLYPQPNWDFRVFWTQEQISENSPLHQQNCDLSFFYSGTNFRISQNPSSRKIGIRGFLTQEEIQITLCVCVVPPQPPNSSKPGSKIGILSVFLDSGANFRKHSPPPIPPRKIGIWGFSGFRNKFQKTLAAPSQGEKKFSGFFWTQDSPLRSLRYIPRGYRLVCSSWGVLLMFNIELWQIPD